MLKIGIILGSTRPNRIGEAVAQLSLYTGFENFSTFKPGDQHRGTLSTMLDQVIAWGNALKSVRSERQPAHA